MCIHSITETSRTNKSSLSLLKEENADKGISFSVNNLHKDNTKSNKDALSLSLMNPFPFNEHNPIAPNYDNPHHIQYIFSRKREILYLCGLSRKWNFNFSIVFQSISYLDRLFLTTECPFNIREVSLICFALSLKFNGSCIQTQVERLSHIINEEIVNFGEKELICLKLLQYDLSSHASSYDIIERIFNTSSTFTSALTHHKDLLYSQCLNLCYVMLIDPRSLDFSSSVLAYSIIKVASIQLGLSRMIANLSCALKTVNYHHIEMSKCHLVLNAVLESYRAVTYKRKEKKKKDMNCSSSTTDSIENK